MTALALRAVASWGAATFAALAGLRYDDRPEVWVTSWQALAGLALLFLAAGTWAAIADHHMRLIARRRRPVAQPSHVRTLDIPSPDEVLPDPEPFMANITAPHQCGQAVA